VVALRVSKYSEAAALIEQLGKEGRDLLLSPTVSESVKNHFRSAVALTLMEGRAKYSLRELPRQPSAHDESTVSTAVSLPFSGVPSDLSHEVLWPNLYSLSNSTELFVGYEPAAYKDMTRAFMLLSRYQQLVRPRASGAMLEAALAIGGLAGFPTVVQHSVSVTLHSDVRFNALVGPKS
jgi:hypothetical protein